MAERAKRIDEWSEGSGIKVLFISLVGSQGLNLIAADVVILYVSGIKMKRIPKY